MKEKRYDTQTGQLVTVTSINGNSNGADDYMTRWLTDIKITVTASQHSISLLLQQIYINY